MTIRYPLHSDRDYRGFRQARLTTADSAIFYSSTSNPNQIIMVASPGTSELIWTNRIGFFDRIAIHGVLVIIPIAVIIMLFFFSIPFLLFGGSIGELIGGLAIILLIPLIIIGILVFIAMGILHLVSGGGYDATFCVNQVGVGFAGGATMKKINDTLVLASLFTGSPAVVGGALTNAGSDVNLIRWKEIRSLTIRKRDHYILVRPQSLMNPIPLYCTAENLDQVLGIIHDHRPDLV